MTEPTDETATPEATSVKTMIRDFLAQYRHPGAVLGESWSEADVERLAATATCVHDPGPRDIGTGARKCGRCGASLPEN